MTDKNKLLKHKIISIIIGTYNIEYNKTIAHKYKFIE